MSKKEQTEKVVVIVIEGDTEVAFYKRLVQIMRDHCGGRLACSVETIDAAGIGQYKNKVLRIFENRVKKNHPNGRFYVALCHDQDVFELEKTPPVNWQDVKKGFLDSGAEEVCQVKAVYSIEDWFLCDLPGILQYLRLPADTKVPVGNNGYERLTALFKRAKKIYIKGKSKTNAKFVQALDVEKVLLDNCHDIAPLCKLLGVSCAQQKRCLHK